MNTYNRLIDVIEKRGAAHLVLIDPDKLDISSAGEFITICNDAGVDGFLAGGSLMMNSQFDAFLTTVKKHTSKPVIIFPGAVAQISPLADALFFSLGDKRKECRAPDRKACNFGAHYKTHRH